MIIIVFVHKENVFKWTTSYLIKSFSKLKLICTEKKNKKK